MGAYLNSNQGASSYYSPHTYSLEQEVMANLRANGFGGSYEQSDSNTPFHYDNSPDGAFSKGFGAAELTLGGVYAASLLKHVPAGPAGVTGIGMTPQLGNKSYQFTQWAKNSGHMRTASFMDATSKASGHFLSGLTKFGTWFEGASKGVFKYLSGTKAGAITKTGLQAMGKITPAAIKAIGPKALALGARALAFLGAAGPIGWAIGGVALVATAAFLIL